VGALHREAHRLRDKGVPVHAFYLRGSARDKFEEISRTTGGEAQHLNVDGANASEAICALFGQTILRDVAGGDKAMYRGLMNKYAELTHASGRN
jgi:hypothetical protein